MITASQLRSARALIAMEQQELAQLSGLSVPTIQRMEASEDVIRANVDSLMKLIGALDAAGIELIAEGTVSQSGGRGVRLKPTTTDGKPRRLRVRSSREQIERGGVVARRRHQDYEKSSR